MGSLLGIFLVAFIYILDIIYRRKKKSLNDCWKGETLFEIVVVTIIINLIVNVAILLFGISSGGEDIYQCPRDVNESNIVSIEKMNTSTANFFLGTGTIRGVIYYYAFVAEDDGYKLEQFRTSNIIIVETDEQPKYTFNNYRCARPVMSFMWTFGKHYTKTYYYRDQKLYVPKNTIIREFKL